MSMKKTALLKKIGVMAIAALVMILPLYADFNPFNFPDSAEIRRAVKDTWLTAPLEDIRAKTIESRENNEGTLYQIRLEETADDFKIIIAPQSFLSVNRVSGQQTKTVQMEVYPEGAPGSYVLYRSKKDGSPERMCWYFNQDAEVYVQFRKEDTKTVADLLVFGSFAARSVPVGIPFDKMYTTSFSELYRVTLKSLPWQKVTVVPKQYHSSLQMVGVIKDNIMRIDYAEDAAYNESGLLYSITTGKPMKIVSEDTGTSYDSVVADDKNDVLPTGEDFTGDNADSVQQPKKEKRLTLSNAGFIKWIIDGLVEPLTGSGTKIIELLQPTVQYDELSKNGVLSQKWNLSFSLDWSRNLAAKALSARSSRMFNYKEGGVDVTIEPFAAELVDGRPVNVAGYVSETGYAVKKLKSLLYVLAVTEPAYCYLAAIRQPSRVVRSEMAFNECAIFFPYFDDTGRFGCYVFENGREMTLENFCGKYADSFAHLERVKTNDYFFPMTNPGYFE